MNGSVGWRGQQTSGKNTKRKGRGYSWEFAEAEIAKKTPGKTEFANISPLLLMTKAKQMDKHPTMSLLISQAEFIRSELRKWIVSYTERESSEGLGYQTFRKHWKVIRSWIPLQLRLAAEQVFYELGPPYTELITGFRPI